MGRKRYTDEFRASAVLMLEAAGYPDEYGSLAAVSRKLDVPGRTLSRWFNKEQNPPPDRLVREKRGELVERLEDLAHTLLDAIYEDLDINGVDAVKAMTAVGIAVDKLQLLSGKPTERQELKIDDPRQQIISRIDSISARIEKNGGTSGPVA